MENMIDLKTSQKRKSIFKNRNFMFLFTGKLVSQLGDVIYNMAIGWFILTITSSAIQMSIYMALGTIIYVVMCPIGGVIADRIDRKQLIIWMDLIRGFAVAFMGLLMYFNLQSIWFFYISSVILSICGAIFVPASNALIPNIVEEADLTKANSMGGSVQGISNIAGLIAGGILYAVLGIKAIFLLNALSYIICGILEVFIQIKPMEKIKAAEKVKAHFLKELLESYKYIRSQKGLFILMWIGTLINFIIVPLFAVFVPYIFNQILKTGTQQYSYVGAASAIGFIIGAGLLSLLPQRDKINGYIRVGMSSFCILILFIYFSMESYHINLFTPQILIISLILIFGFIGITNAIINVPIGVVMQRIVPNEMLGRTSGLVNTLLMCSMPLGMLIGGIVTDLLPMRYLILSISIIFILTTLYLCLQKDIRKI